MFHWPIRLRNAAFVSWFLPACAACVPIQPSDECTDAPIITDGRYIGSTMEAAGDEFGGCGSFPDPDVWYRYVAPYDGRLSANLSSDSQGDYVLGIWNACPFDDGVELDCNAGAGEIGMPAIEVAISAAQQFWIQVAGHPAREGTFTLTVTSSATAAPSGPDVVPSDITETLAFRPEDGTRAYITDTHTCNVGATDLTWGDTSPLMTWNAYRLAEGRLVQIGNSWVKHGFHANASDGCGVACRGGGGDILEAGCRDVYSADFNSNQNEMGPRSAVNAFSGDYSGPRGDCQIDVSICRYLQIAEADLDAGQYPGALYFFEIVLVASEDAAAGNAANNASHRRVTLDENFLFTPAGPMTVGRPALYAWREHGLGVNAPDPAISLQIISVPGEGHFHLAAKARDLGDGSWRYEYALFNLNSHQSARSFKLVLPAGISVTNVGFDDVDYHSGEIFLGSDWSTVVDAESITWSTQTFDENAEANALRYGTQYNFWFDADAAPAEGLGEIALFRPGDPASVGFATRVPGTP